MRVNFRLTGILGYILILAVLMATQTSAAGLRDIRDGWLFTVSDHQQILASKVDSLTTKKWVLETGQSCLFGMPELQVNMLGGGFVQNIRGTKVALQLSWQKTGQDLFSENVWSLKMSACNNPELGIFMRRSDLCFLNENVSQALELWLTAKVHLSGGPTANRLELQMPLNHPPPWFGQGGRRQLVKLVIPNRPIGFAAALDQRGDGTPCLTFDFVLALTRKLGIGCRADPSTGTLGPTTIWSILHLTVRTSHLLHPDLGVTHRFALAVSKSGVRR